MIYTTYRVNFEKLYIFKNSNILNGFEVNKNMTKIKIDETCVNPITQILFMLKEFFVNKHNGIWNEFTKDELNDLIKQDEYIYRKECQSFGNDFIRIMYNKVDYFLNAFCDKKIVEIPNREFYKCNLIN